MGRRDCKVPSFVIVRIRIGCSETGHTLTKESSSGWFNGSVDPFWFADWLGWLQKNDIVVGLACVSELVYGMPHTVDRLRGIGCVLCRAQERNAGTIGYCNVLNLWRVCRHDYRIYVLAI